MSSWKSGRLIMTLLLAATVIAAAPLAASAVPAIGATSLTWSQPKTLTSRVGGPTAISCPTASFCMLGDEGGWTATRGAYHWSAPQPVDPAVLPGRFRITDVSCVSSSMCMAVTSLGDASRWNGHGWSSLTRLSSTDVNAVSCGSARSCLAVHGAYLNRWNGSSWSAPQLTGGRGVQFTSVSCGSPSACMIVGNDAKGANYAWRWVNGSVLRPVRIYDNPFDVIASVDCIGVSFCVAGGDQAALRWNGRNWALTYNQPTSYRFASMSCVSTRSCYAPVDTAGAQHVERFDGTRWTYSAAAPFSSTGSDVSCVLGGRCVVVSSDGYEIVRTSSWHPRAVAEPSFGQITGLDCASPSLCEATTSALGTLSWDGRWHSPRRSLVPTDLSVQNAGGDVRCPSTTFCLAVSVGGTAAFRFDGSRWARTVSTRRSVTTDCRSSHFCLGIDAEGYDEIYDGQGWTVGRYHRLERQRAYSVSCPDATACLAADDAGNAVLYDLRTHRWRTLPALPGAGHLYSPSLSCSAWNACLVVDGSDKNARWDGRRWQPVAASGDYLTDVSCLASSFCVAVGGGRAHVWDGTTWSQDAQIYSGADDPRGDNSLEHVSCAGTAATPTCVATGSHDGFVGTA